MDFGHFKHAICSAIADNMNMMRSEHRSRPAEFTYRHARRLFGYAQKTADELFESLKSSRNGLRLEQVKERQKSFGLNEITGAGKVSALKILLKAFHNPFNYLISTLAVVSYLTDDLRAAILMAVMVVLSVLLTFVQELRSSRAAEGLSAMVRTNATVVRGGDIAHKFEIPISQLVPGDLIYLSSGDMVPADVRLLSAKHLAVSQSALTGESIPVEKTAERDDGVMKDLPELRNICFMGSNIASGAALAIVLHTGPETYFGSIAKTLVGARVETSFDKGIHGFTRLMLKFMFVMVPLVFFINGFTKGNWSDAFLFAVAIAVGLTPEMLPMIVTANLAKGALAMSKKKVIVKRLNAIQNFGAMDVLCTDKTGTLTEDLVVYGGSYGPFGNEDDFVLQHACLNSLFQNGLKNFLDVALIEHARTIAMAAALEDYHLIDELPFDFERKRMSVLVEEKGGRRVLICKGATEEVIAVCTAARNQSDTMALNPESKELCHATARLMNERGLRVIAIAMKELPATQKGCELSDETDLILLGYVAFLDPPTKESAFGAIQALARYGVAVKILTGDNERVTKKVALEVGLNVDAVLLGHQIAAMSDEELKVAVEKTAIFAKLTPDQKQRIIHALHDGGHVVGFIGDGINDAPALRAADVGISVNNAVDIAKEAADIILLEKSLMVLEEGVVEGRKVFGNIIKYIKMGASSNFGNVFSMLGASLLLPFLPLRPVQMLTQNLLYDFSQIAIPLDQVDAEYLEKPRKWEIEGIQRFMVFMGPVSSIFDYATFGLMWFYFKANSPQSQGLFQSAWFVEGLLSQTLIVHLIRTRRIPFLQSRASTPLLVTTAIVMAVGLYLPFSSFGASLGFVPLPLTYFPWLVGILVLYCVLAQLVKVWFTKKYGYH